MRTITASASQISQVMIGNLLEGLNEDLESGLSVRFGAYSRKIHHCCKCNAYYANIALYAIREVKMLKNLSGVSVYREFNEQ